MKESKDKDEDIEMVPVDDEDIEMVPVDDEDIEMVPVDDEDIETVPVDDEDIETVPVDDEDIETVPVDDEDIETVPVDDEDIKTVPVDDEDKSVPDVKLESVLDEKFTEILEKIDTGIPITSKEYRYVYKGHINKLKEDDCIISHHLFIFSHMDNTLGYRGGECTILEIPRLNSYEYNNFVIDCFTISDNHSVVKYMDDVLGPKSEIHAVSISHGHEDHCRGIIDLVKEKAIDGVKIFFPNSLTDTIVFHDFLRWCLTNTFSQEIRRNYSDQIDRIKTEAQEERQSELDRIKTELNINWNKHVNLYFPPELNSSNNPYCTILNTFGITHTETPPRYENINGFHLLNTYPIIFPEYLENMRMYLTNEIAQPEDLIKMKYMNSSKANNSSKMFLVKPRLGGSIFFPGDVQKERWAKFKGPLQCTILKIPHHGAENAIPENKNVIAAKYLVKQLGDTDPWPKKLKNKIDYIQEYILNFGVTDPNLVYWYNNDQKLRSVIFILKGHNDIDIIKIKQSIE
jgi:hypothetical protein